MEETIIFAICVAIGILSFWQMKELDKETEGRDFDGLDCKMYGILAIGVIFGVIAAIILFFKFLIWIIELAL
jgi:TM2 domain-containing membrane protein YozV